MYLRVSCPLSAVTPVSHGATPGQLRPCAGVSAMFEPQLLDLDYIRVFVRFLLPILIIIIASGELSVRPTEAGLLYWCTLVKVADNEGCSLPESWAVSAPKTSYYGDNGAVAFIEYPICHLQQSSFSHSSQRKDNPGHIDPPSCLPWLLLSEIRNIRRKIN